MLLKGNKKKMCVHEINKIITYTSIVTVHICKYMHGYCSKYVNIYSFRKTDVEDFWGKICKIGCFLYFAKFYIH